MFDILKNKHFRYFFSANIISNIGTAMSFIGFNWYILKVTSSNANVGFLISLSIVFGLLTSPFAGPIADHFDRRKVLIISNLIRGSIIAAVTLIYFGTDFFNLKYIYFLSAIAGIGWSIQMPISRAIIQEILDKDSLLKGNSFIEISIQTASFTAAAIAGVLYRFLGLSAILIFDSVTFFIAALLLYNMNYTSQLEKKGSFNFFIQLKEGIVYLIHNKVVLGFGIIILIPFIATMCTNVIMPGYVSDYLKRDAVVFGVADMFYGIGALISGFVSTLFVHYLKRKKALLAFFMISIAAVIFLYFNQWVAGLYIAGLFFGLGNSALRIIFNTVLMEVVPKKFFGRLMAVSLAFSNIMQIISTSSIGVIVDRFTTRSGWLVLLGLMLIALVSGFYFYFKILRLNKAAAT